MAWKISLNCLSLLKGYGRPSPTFDLEAAGLFHYRLAYLDTQVPHKQSISYQALSYVALIELAAKLGVRAYLLPTGNCSFLRQVLTCYRSLSCINPSPRKTHIQIWPARQISPAARLSRPRVAFLIGAPQISRDACMSGTALCKRGHVLYLYAPASGNRPKSVGPAALTGLSP